MELTDEQLNNVSGGGGGAIPSDGITYSIYTTIFGGHYYAKKVGDTDLIRTEVVGFSANYYQEKLIIDTEKNTWSTELIAQLSGQPANFYSTYPYVLNIRP